MDKYYKVHLAGTAPDDVMLSGMYVDENGVLYFFDTRKIKQYNDYMQIILNAGVVYAAGVWTKVVAVYIEDTEYAV